MIDQLSSVRQDWWLRNSYKNKVLII